MIYLLDYLNILNEEYFWLSNVGIVGILGYHNCNLEINRMALIIVYVG